MLMHRTEKIIPVIYFYVFGANVRLLFYDIYIYIDNKIPFVGKHPNLVSACNNGRVTFMHQLIVSAKQSTSTKKCLNKSIISTFKQ